MKFPKYMLVIAPQKRPGCSLTSMGPGHALNYPRAKLFRMFRNFFLHRIGNERGDDRPASRKDPQEKPDDGSAENRRAGVCPILQGGQEIFDLGLKDEPLHGLLYIEQDF